MKVLAANPGDSDHAAVACCRRWHSCFYFTRSYLKDYSLIITLNVFNISSRTPTYLFWTNSSGFASRVVSTHIYCLVMQAELTSSKLNKFRLILSQLRENIPAAFSACNTLPFLSWVKSVIGWLRSFLEDANRHFCLASFHWWEKSCSLVTC